MESCDIWQRYGYRIRGGTSQVKSWERLMALVWRRD